MICKQGSWNVTSFSSPTFAYDRSTTPPTHFCGHVLDKYVYCTPSLILAPWLQVVEEVNGTGDEENNKKKNRKKRKNAEEKLDEISKLK